MINMNTDIERFKMLFECYNQPDIKLTDTGIIERDNLFVVVNELYTKINKCE